MKSIPKFPAAPDLTRDQIDVLTNFVFLPKKTPTPSDVIFVFGCPDPTIWDVVFRLYQDHMGRDIVVTGGYNPNPKLPQKLWNYGEAAEADVITDHLIDMGIPSGVIHLENKSRNSLENVLFAKAIYDFSNTQSVIFVCKEPAAGRQYRTLRKHLPSGIEYTPFPYSTNLGGDTNLITRDDWMDTPEGRSFVFGSYLRNVAYGEKGDIYYEGNPLPEFKTYIDEVMSV